MGLFFTRKNKFDIEGIKLIFEEDLEDILKIYFTSTDDNIYNLRMAFKDEDIQTIRFESHSLIGSSAAIKGDRLYDAACKINSLCKEDLLVQSENALDKFCKIYFEYKKYIMNKMPSVFK